MAVSLNQERITNMTFFIDEKYNIINANRSLLRFLSITKTNINLKDFLLREGVNELNKVIELKQRFFTTKICTRENEIPSLLVFDYLYDVIKVELIALANLYNAYNYLDFNTKQYEALLTALDYYYWLYDPSDKSIIFKNTRELGVLFQGDINSFHDYFVDNFEIENSERAIKHLDYDLNNNWADKRYKFTSSNNSSIILKTKSFNSKGKTYFLGSYSFEEDVLTTEQYIEKRDAVTGVYNRETIEDMVKNYVAANREFSLVMVNVDRFKKFNDIFGHAYGDKVLATVANEIKDSIKTMGHIGRISGDEFLCIVETINEDSLRAAITDMRSAVQWALPAHNTESLVTCSFGIARFPLNTTNSDTLYDLTDKCLEIAKSKGRNCYIIYKPALHDSAIRELEEQNAELYKTNKYFDNVKKQYEMLNSINSGAIYEQLANYLGMDKITIYDANLNLVRMIGNGEKEPRASYVKKADYFKYFNEYGYLQMDNTNILDTLDKEKLDMYMLDNISTSLEIVKKDRDGNILGLICFDKYKPAKTFADEQVKFTLFISELLKI